jgi:HSP20 family protein
MSENSSKPDAQHPEAEKPSETQFLEAASFTWRFSTRTPSWRPPTDVYETDHAIIVRVEIPGMQEDDFAIEINGRTISIRGARQDELSERRAYHQMEIHFGEFNFEIELPFQIESSQVEALYQNGFLRIVLQKALPRQIRVVE